MNSPSYINDVSIKTFAAEVIEASKNRLVLVDFWSGRSSVSKTLSPILVKLVTEQGGAARLARVDIDKNPQIAQQMQLQSAPTIYAFSDGKILDGFVGSMPEDQIKQWLEKLIKATNSKPEDDDGSGDVESALTQAETHFMEGDLYTAAAIYIDILDYAPDEPRAHAGQIRCLLAENKNDEAQKLIDALPPAIAEDTAMEPLRTILELAKETEGNNNDVSALETKLEKSPDDHQTRFDLAMAYYSAKNNDSAVDALLEIIRRDRTWKKDKARKQLLKLFDAFGQMDPLTISARKRLSTILFS